MSIQLIMPLAPPAGPLLFRKWSPGASLSSVMRQKNKYLPGLAIFYPPGQNFDRLQSKHAVSGHTPSMEPLLAVGKILIRQSNFCPGRQNSDCLVRISTASSQGMQSQAIHLAQSNCWLRAKGQSFARASNILPTWSEL